MPVFLSTKHRHGMAANTGDCHGVRYLYPRKAQSVRRICGYRPALVRFNYRPTNSYVNNRYTYGVSNIQTQNHRLYYYTNVSCLYNTLIITATPLRDALSSCTPHTSHVTALQTTTPAA